MGFFRNLLRGGKPKLPFRIQGSGKTKEDPAKLIPYNLDTMIDGLAKILKKTKPELFIGDDESNKQMLSGMASGLCKNLYFEDQFGKEGVGYKYGSRMYYDQGIVSQELIWANKTTETVYYDISCFEFAAKKDTDLDYVVPKSFLENPICKSLSQKQKESVRKQLSYFGDNQIHPEVAHEIFSAFAAIGLCNLSCEEVILGNLDDAFSTLKAAQKIYGNESLEKQFENVIGSIAIVIVAKGNNEASTSHQMMINGLKDSIEESLRKKYSIN